ncbi:hypothetical protein D1AOALGA4SA_5028 [Olavius algarvensis Delta 1 endosymbiont]|nr:hypothetical protein D1AOALGA4SA_5028 [Olavius algarvensis Delta 1 endosymbiont]
MRIFGIASLYQFIKIQARRARFVHCFPATTRQVALSIKKDPSPVDPVFGQG